jgi:hypothetical protein
MIKKLKEELLKAATEIGSNILIYEINFWFGLPSHSLKINDIELFKNYNIPNGYDGIGLHELNILEKDGFLKKVSEQIDEIDPLDKTIIYEISYPELNL